MNTSKHIAMIFSKLTYGIQNMRPFQIIIHDILIVKLYLITNNGNYIIWVFVVTYYNFKLKKKKTIIIFKIDVIIFREHHSVWNTLNALSKLRTDEFSNVHWIVLCPVSFFPLYLQRPRSYIYNYNYNYYFHYNY